MQESPHDMDKHSELLDIASRLSDAGLTDVISGNIELCQRALSLVDRSEDPVLWARFHSKLASFLREDWSEHRADSLTQAIEHYQQALRVFTRQDFPQDWALTQRQLGNAFLARISEKKADNVEQAIEHYQQALEVFTPQGFPEDWANTHGNLGIAFGERPDGKRADNLEQAIEHFQQALKVFTRQAFPQDGARIQRLLGHAFLERIDGENADNVEQAIAHYQQVLEVFTPQDFPREWALVQMNLGNAFRQRVREPKTDNQERSIKHYQHALEVFTEQGFPEDEALTQMNLGIAFQLRILGNQEDNVEKALEHSLQALKIFTQRDSPVEWASVQINLAEVYRKRMRGKKAGNLEQALKHSLQALEVFTRHAFPEDWARIQMVLSNVFWERSLEEKADNVPKAIAHCQQALEVFTLQAFPQWHRDVQFTLGNIYFECERWSEAHAAFSAAIEAGELLLQAAYTEAGQLVEVGSAARLYAQDAWCLLRLKKPDEALQRLEQGKARLLDEALALAEAEEATLLSGTAQEALRAARQTVRKLVFEARLPPGTNAPREDRALAEALLQARSHLNEVVSRIREEHPNFMPRGLPLPEVLGLIPVGGAMVVPLVTSKGTAILVLPQGTQAVGETHVVWSDSFTVKTLGTLLLGPADSPQPTGWLGTYVESSDTPERPDVRKRWFGIIESTGQALWEAVMGPVHARLKALGLAEGAPVLLIPQGTLGTLPLHAAWRAMNDGSRRYFLDDWTVTYAPGGYALAISRRRLQEPQRHHRTLLAVIPTSNLKYAPSEGHAVAAMFPDARCLEGPQATPARVIEQVHGCNYLHFSCHGLYDWKDVMQSHLVLTDHQWLTLARIIAKFEMGNCRLVALSACETGLIDLGQAPDEYLGLPAGFLQAGAPTVLSTLWSVDELSTWLLIERFYHHLEQGLTPAASLRQAQRWLRDLRVDELRQYLEEQKPEVTRHIPASLSQRFETVEPDRQPFERPFWWAAFTVTGA